MIRRALVAIVVTVVTGFGVGLLAPTSVAAADCDERFLTFVPWHYMLPKDADCSVIADFDDQDGSVVFVWTIILNIVSILFSLVGYLALGFVIYGGYLYVLARGDAGRIAKGKRTVISALVGLVICIVASLIVSAIVGIIAGAVGA